MLLLTALNRQRVLIPIPFVLAEMQAGLLEVLPNSPLTRDQVRLLKTDEVVSGMEPTLGDLGVHMQPLAMICVRTTIPERPHEPLLMET